MPKYLDHHRPVDLPPTEVDQLVSDVKARRRAPDGTVLLNTFLAKNEGWCLIEAPSAESVHKHHEAIGIKLEKGQVVEVMTLV